MALRLKIKEEHKTTIVGFGNSGLPLGERPESDLFALAKMAKYDPYLASMFEELPGDDEISEEHVNNFLATHPAPVTAAASSTSIEPAPEETVNENHEED